LFTTFKIEFCLKNPKFFTETFNSIEQTKRWANAQRDGRSAEYRWRPLFNAAKFGGRPLLEWRAVTLPRRETSLNLQRCRKTNETISGASGRKFSIVRTCGRDIAV